MPVKSILLRAASRSFSTWPLSMRMDKRSAEWSLGHFFIGVLQEIFTGLRWKFLTADMGELSYREAKHRAPHQNNPGCTADKGLFMMRLFYRGFSRDRSLLPVPYTIAPE